MTQTTQIETLRRIKFGERQVPSNSKDEVISDIVQSYGVVYATSITRDGCSGCEEQKPLFQALAEKLVATHSGRVGFSNVHVRYTKDDPNESMLAKKTLRHGAYPTYMIHVRSAHGPLELYRAIYPKMEDLEKQILESFELAEHYEKEAHKA